MKKIDLGKAFTYVFEDENWLAKVAIGTVLYFIPIIGMASIGYSIIVMNKIYDDTYAGLPAWDDFGEKFMKGFWFCLALLVFSLPGLIMLGASVMPIVTAMFARGTFDVSMLLGSGMLMAGLAGLWFLLLALIGPSIYMNYAVKGSAFDLGGILGLITSNAGKYLTLCAYLIIVGLVSGVVSSLPSIGSFISMLLAFYFSLVAAHIFAQAAKEMKIS